MADRTMESLTASLSEQRVRWEDNRPGSAAAFPTGPGAFRKRDPDRIEAVCVHQTLCESSPRDVAHYHASPGCHIAEAGCPGLCYALIIDDGGCVHVAWDLDAMTWSQAPHNRDWLAVAVCGDFDGPGHDGSTEAPTTQQVYALERVLDWAESVGITGIRGHFDVGKPACPGHTLGMLVRALRGEVTVTGPRPVTDWQAALELAGFDPGEIDGRWGVRSMAALRKFQASVGMEPTGVCGEETWAALQRRE